MNIENKVLRGTEEEEEEGGGGGGERGEEETGEGREDLKERGR